MSVIAFIRSKKSLYNNLLLIHSYAYTFRFGLFYVLFRFCSIKKNKIVFCSYYGKGFGDNAKYIALELLKQNNNYDLVWQLSPSFALNHGLPHQIRSVKYGSIREIYELCTAKFWIDNSRKSYKIFKRKSQFYIQTWHGSLGVKMVEKDAIDTLSAAYIAAAKADSRMANLFVSSCKHIRNLYRNSFWYDGEIIEAGCPRNDLFFTDLSTVRQRVKQAFAIGENIKIALYAPTFRKKSIGEHHDLFFEQCVDALKHRFGGNWVILMRLHPNRATQSIEIENPNLVKNATRYDDMQELLAVSDVLITDYSSSVFDYAIQRRPAFLFTLDENEYSKDRGFYFDINNLPFPKASSNVALCDSIINFDETSYRQAVDSFYEKTELFEDGNASRRLVERIKHEIARS